MHGCFLVSLTDDIFVFLLGQHKGFLYCSLFFHGRYFLFNTPLVLLISGQDDIEMERMDEEEDEGKQL